MDKVTRQCLQTTTFLMRKESRSGIEPRSFRLPLGQTGSLEPRPKAICRRHVPAYTVTVHIAQPPEGCPAVHCEHPFPRQLPCSLLSHFYPAVCMQKRAFVLVCGNGHFCSACSALGSLVGDGVSFVFLHMQALSRWAAVWYLIKTAVAGW